MPSVNDDLQLRPLSDSERAALRGVGSDALIGQCGVGCVLVAQDDDDRTVLVLLVEDGEGDVQEWRRHVRSAASAQSFYAQILHHCDEGRSAPAIARAAGLEPLSSILGL